MTNTFVKILTKYFRGKSKFRYLTTTAIAITTFTTKAKTFKILIFKFGHGFIGSNCFANKVSLQEFF